MLKKLILFFCVLMAGCELIDNNYVCKYGEVNIPFSLTTRVNKAFFLENTFLKCFSEGNEGFYNNSCKYPVDKDDWKFSFNKVSKLLTLKHGGYYSCNKI